MSEERTPDSVYESFWKDIIEENGVINMSKLKNELFDYVNQMREWSIALCELTNGQLSKSNYKAETMIDEITGAFEDSMGEEV